MSHTEAVAADRNEDVLRAVELYEASILDAPEEMVINLAVLYWQITNYGFWSALRLPPDLVKRAGPRMDELFDEAARRAPRSPAVEFWKKYIAWADLGENLDPEDCRRLLREHPAYLEPALFLFATSGGREYEHEARLLLAQCQQAGTTRARYVKSVLESTLSQLERGG